LQGKTNRKEGGRSICTRSIGAGEIGKPLVKEERGRGRVVLSTWERGQHIVEGEEGSDCLKKTSKEEKDPMNKALPSNANDSQVSQNLFTFERSLEEYGIKRLPPSTGGNVLNTGGGGK